MFGEFDAAIERKLKERDQPTWHSLTQHLDFEGTWEILGWKLAETANTRVYFTAYYKDMNVRPPVEQRRSIIFVVLKDREGQKRMWIPAQFVDLLALAVTHLSQEERVELYTQLRDFMPAIQ